MRTLLFAFKDTVAEQVAREFAVGADTFYLDSSLRSIEDFIQTTDFTKYSHIIGLGVYSGRDQEKIRIETQCTNQFRNKKEDLEVLLMPHFIQPNEHVKLAGGIGNSWCNLVSYKLLKKMPDAKYTFLHVPKAFTVDTAIAAVRNSL